ncbi:Uncharacterized protein PBTT_04798 [Plasmodiophora brassicae]
MLLREHFGRFRLQVSSRQAWQRPAAVLLSLGSTGTLLTHPSSGHQPRFIADVKFIEIEQQKVEQQTAERRKVSVRGSSRPE